MSLEVSHNLSISRLSVKVIFHHNNHLLPFCRGMCLARKSLPYAPWLLGMMISTATMGMTALVISILGARSNVSVETSRRLGGGGGCSTVFSLYPTGPVHHGDVHHFFIGWWV